MAIMKTITEFKPYAPDFEDGEYLNAVQKRKICKLLRQGDHKYQYAVAANHVGASIYDLDNERSLDKMFDLAIKEIDTLWADYMRKQSYDMSAEVEGTAAERVRHLEATMPEKFSQKFKLEHEVSEPNPRLVEVIRNALSRKKLKVSAA